MRNLLVMLAALLGLGGCGSVDVERYRESRPQLDLRRYFDGTIDAYGMFQDRSGRVVKRFHVVIEASWQGDSGTLDERFMYADGSTQRRVWSIRRLDAHRYVGRAADVVGEAVGEGYGNALRWRYRLSLPVDGKVYEVDLDDWMFLVTDEVMLNRSVMSKFGVHLGEVTLSFHKRAG